MIKNYELYTHKDVSTIKGFLKYCTDTYGSKTAFMYADRKTEVSVSFSQFRESVEALGTYLYANGYRNRHIAVFGENSYEWIMMHFAVTCGGNIVIPIDKELNADSIAELLQDSDSEVLVYSITYADIAEQLKDKLPDIAYINMKEIASLVEKGKELVANGYTDYLDIAVEKDNLASIVYTSGTTGRSKGVMLTHRNFMTNLYAASCYASLSGPSILLLPLHHTFGLVAGLYSVMYYGYPLYINKSLKKLLSDFQTAKPQSTFAVPLIVETLHRNIWHTAKKQGKDKALKLLIRISNTLRKCKIDLRKTLFKSVISAFGGNLDLIICGGAPLNPELVTAFDSLGITLLNGYGITECSPIVAVNRNKFNVVGSVGLPLICNEVKISEDGEVLVRGENVMVGYYRNDAENEKVFADGWFRTGDLGKIDDYGALHITGRIKNLIILSNGENISAESIEERVYSIPYVKEAVAYGENDVIVVEVFLDDEIPDAKERIDADIRGINQGLPLVKNIGKVIIRDTEFPKTTTKKIKRNYGGQ